MGLEEGWKQEDERDKHAGYIEMKGVLTRNQGHRQRLIDPLRGLCIAYTRIQRPSHYTHTHTRIQRPSHYTHTHTHQDP